MKATTVLSTALLALAATMWTHAAQADSMQANCEVRKDGDKMKGKSGPCTFGQRQGYIDIDLRNGDVFSLKPAGQADHFKDQKGNKVVRTRAGGNTQEFKWEGGKKLIVTFDSYSNQGNGYNNGNTASDGSHSINRMSNGGFEVVWTKHGCIASYNKHGQSTGYSKGCSQSQVERSDQAARNER